MNQGIIILGHGSKAKEADEVLSRITQMVKEKGNFQDIAMASLQFSRPTLDESIEAMVNDGISRIIVVPMFIFPGNHVKEDIPEALDTLRQRYPSVKIDLARHMGADERIAGILLDCISEVL